MTSGRVRSTALWLLVCVVFFATACTHKTSATSPPQATQPACEPKPFFVGVAVAVGTPDVADVLNKLMSNLRERVMAASGFTGATIALQPITDDSFSEPSRTIALGCVPADPVGPGASLDSDYTNKTSLDTYNGHLATVRRARADVAGRLDTFANQFNVSSAAPVTRRDVWGSLAALGHATANAHDEPKVIVIISGDEDSALTQKYCKATGCQSLAGVRVVWFGLDLPDASDQRRRESDWTYFLQQQGVRSIKFIRSGEAGPSIFEATLS